MVINEQSFLSRICSGQEYQFASTPNIRQFPNVIEMPPHKHAKILMRHLPSLVTVSTLSYYPAVTQAKQVYGKPVPAAGAAEFDSAWPSAVPVQSPQGWRKQAQVNLAAYANALRQNYIYAVYPDPARWRAWFDRTLAVVEAELSLIRDKACY